MNKSHFKSGDNIMGAYNGYAFMPVMQVVKVTPNFYVCKQLTKIDPDNEQEHLTEDEFIIAKAWEWCYIRVKFEHNN